MKSNLDLVNDCDNYQDGYNPSVEYRLMHESQVLGDMRPEVVHMLEVVAYDQKLDRYVGVVADHAAHTFRFDGLTPEERSEIVVRLARRSKEAEAFKLLERWRDELYPVYGCGKELLFNVERSFCPLLGVITYGVHMTAYVRTPYGIKIWVPRRNKTKYTYGGMLDNTVAGGISSGETPLDGLMREAEEEASLSRGLVRTHAKACGTVTYFHMRDEKAGGETGLYQPECQYVYDLELGPEVTPEPNDDEVENFQLWDVKQVQDAMGRGEFKPNCALVMLDFFIRHGILTPENEPDYIEIVARIHRRFEFPTA